mmetsp:Transcript_24930/g.80303  ORF Transcript_24930/g.80303 Transcript_24930/m.80303 type:complete len:123 (+) Transcript_24930:479-847(+)
MERPQVQAENGPVTTVDLVVVAPVLAAVGGAEVVENAERIAIHHQPNVHLVAGMQTSPLPVHLQRQRMGPMSVLDLNGGHHQLSQPHHQSLLSVALPASTPWHPSPASATALMMLRPSSARR